MSTKKTTRKTTTRRPAAPPPPSAAAGRPTAPSVIDKKREELRLAEMHGRLDTAKRLSEELADLLK